MGWQFNIGTLKVRRTFVRLVDDVRHGASGDTPGRLTLEAQPNPFNLNPIGVKFVSRTEPFMRRSSPHG